MRRTWFIAAIVVGVVAIALAALAMRLTADDSEPSATEWADSVCTSLGDWRASIVALTDVSGGLSKESLEQKLDDAQTATGQLASDLHDLGAPDLDAGEEARRQLDSAVASLRSDYESLQADAEAALESADTAAELMQTLPALVPQFQALLTSASQVVDDVRAADVPADVRSELEEAFADASSCQELRSGS